MKKILLITFSIIFVMLSCKSTPNPLDPKYSGELYISVKPVNSTYYIAVNCTADGGFELFDSDSDGNLMDANKKSIVTGNDMRGEDPNYNFQTGELAGSIQFISSTAIKITVTFNSENSSSSNIKDVLCYKKTS